MSMTCTQVRGVLIDGALGQADALELAAARAHEASCADCRDEGSALRATVELLRQVPPVAPSEQFAERLEARLDAAERNAPRILRAPRPMQRITVARVAVAAGFIALLLTAASYVLRERGGAPDSERGGDVVRFRVGDPAAAPVAHAPEASQFQDRGGVPPRLHSSDEAPLLPAPPWFDELDPQLQQLAAEEIEQLKGLDRAAFEQWRLSHLTGAPVGPLRQTPVATPATPVDRALEWLVRSQREDGSWGPGFGEPGLDTGVTALALLAFVSAGHLGSPSVHPFDAAVDRAGRWLAARQDPADGSFRGGQDDAANFFCHAVACLALVEQRVRVTAADPARALQLEPTREKLERALSRLEVQLARLRDADVAGMRCTGQDAAWTALAVTTARHGGIDFHLKFASEELANDVLARLRNDRRLGSDQPDVLLAASTAICSMAERAPPQRDDRWERAVAQVLRDPGQVEPSLRFLVATALANAHDRKERKSSEFRNFEEVLLVRLVALQQESGHFDSGIVWDCFGGGAVYETALAVLTLTVGERTESFQAARTRNERRPR